MEGQWSWLIWLRALTGFMLVSLGWALVTPLTAAPDEPSHMINAAAVVRGQWIVATSTQTDAEGISLHEVTVPEYVANTLGQPGCYVFQPTVPASCRVGSGGDSPVVVNDPVANYPPLYYAMVGIASLVTSGDAALYGMRILGAAISSVLFATGYAALAGWRGRATAIAAGALITPMTFYLAGTVNPQSMEILSAFALASVLFLLSVHSGTSVRAVVLVAGAVTATLLFSRPVGAVWAALIVLVGAALLDGHAWRRLVQIRAFWAAVGIGFVALTAAVLWQFLAKPGDSIRPVPVPGVDSLQTLVQYTVANASGYWKAAIGNLGWLDANPPSQAVAAFTLAFVLTILVGLVFGDWRTRAGIIFLILAVPFSIVALQYPSLDEAGVIWQGRYSLPLLSAATVLAALHPVSAIATGRAIVVSALSAVAHLGVMLTGVERFYSGLGNGIAFEDVTTMAWFGIVLWLLGAGFGLNALVHVASPDSCHVG